MRFYAEYKQQMTKQATEAGVAAVEEVFVSTIARSRDWAQSQGKHFDSLVESMAQQLPDNDVDRFLDSVRFGFHSRTLDAGLTGSLVTTPHGDPGTATHYFVYLRVRAYLEDPRKEAELPGIGLEIANALLKALPEMEQSAMIVWQDRAHDPVLHGAVRRPKRLLDVLRELPATTALAAISGVLLVVLALWAIALDRPGSSAGVPYFLASDPIDWFKRLVGPLSSTLVASIVAIFFVGGRRRFRSAYWQLGDQERMGAEKAAL